MKIKAVLLSLAMVFFVGCSSNETEVETQEELKPHQISSEDIDYDLREMSSTMVYSQIFDLVTNPNEYTDARFVIQGHFMESEDMNTGEKFFAILIVDAAACCAQGLEIHIPDDVVLPIVTLPAEMIIEGTVGVKTVGDYDFPYILLENAQMA